MWNVSRYPWELTFQPHLRESGCLLSFQEQQHVLAHFALPFFLRPLRYHPCRVGVAEALWALKEALAYARAMPAIDSLLFSWFCATQLSRCSPSVENICRVFHRRHDSFQRNDKTKDAQAAMQREPCRIPSQPRFR
ncbi:hypothetical protein COCCADRAFT_82450 [Bipolaris zeicola 26-R-13]|uniref:Uncharacterized protein n=1 Tax=Cochliobolus carbonum (strain 26-R-13) TaxID=930089 RepID=W6YTJ2_COCC2|nr:uncharacterized protein COCCADRAFT_82450 [Bipolaris zeicola 26-R-13]EUC38714.1 hypothetical protein COCCADRAFT_82450 [Bipolaris zeicola 26-R-13]